MSNACETCGAIFPDEWTKPVKCTHKFPGRDYRKRTAAKALVNNGFSTPNAWQVIHSHIADHIKSGRKWNPSEQRQWYSTNFVPLIPRDGCSCKDHWSPIEAKIDWSTAESAEMSFYEAHNEVSTKYAGHPPISLEQAREIWFGPRIAFIAVNYANHGGTETFHQTLLPRLRHYRNIVGFGCIHGGGDPLLLKVPYHQGREAVADLCTKADIVVTWGIDALTNLLPSPRPKVIAVHHGDKDAGWIGETMWQSCVDEFVCVNREAAEYIKVKRDLPVHWIPNSLNLDRIKTTPKLNVIRDSVAGKRVVLFGHRFSEEKRPKLAVEMASCLPDDWILVMAGDGPLRPSSVPDNVRLVGQVDTLADWLAVADCFISMSTFEGFGLSMAEASAAGVPIVATPKGIGPDVANILLPVSSTAKEWAQAVAQSAESPTVRPDVTDKFGIDRHVSAWASILKL